MNHTWNVRFLKLAKEVSSWSKDQSSQVGAVIVTPDKNPVSFGYNGMPPGIDDSVSSRHERPEKYFWMEHAERNAIYQADRHLLKDSIIYVTHHPCADCARAIIKSKISEVVIIEENGLDSEVVKRNQNNFDVSRQMLEESGIIVRTVKQEDLK